jgi:large subunit ribosomal protein L9
MKVILLKDVKGVGKRFEERNVSNGHASNFLIPKKLAVPASGHIANEIRIRIEQETLGREKEGERLTQEIARISGIILKVNLRSNEQGHLFEKLDRQKIQLLLEREKSVRINVENIALDKPIKEVGKYNVPLKFSNSDGEIKETHFTLEVDPLN